MRMLLAAGAAIGLILAATPGEAESVQYVKICPVYGEGWFYIPGTDHCVKAETGEVRWEEEDGTHYSTIDMLKTVNEGVALSFALPGATIDPGKSFGLGVNFGTFGGETALGVSGSVKASDGVTLNGGLGVGTQGDVGGRAGVNLSW